MGCLRRVLRKKSGLGQRAFKIIYKGLFAASMAYGVSVLFRFLRLGYARDALNSIQRQVLYRGLNVFSTVSTDAMQLLCGELP